MKHKPQTQLQEKGYSEVQTGMQTGRERAAHESEVANPYWHWVGF